jgi:hypothetical protein
VLDALLPKLNFNRIGGGWSKKIIEVDSISEVGVVWCVLYVA